MPRHRSATAGQAALDYVGVVSLVAVVIVAALAVAGPASFAATVTGQVRHAICVVTGAYCSTAEARAAGLDPCVRRSRAEGERVIVKAFVVRLARGDEALVEHMSDESARVSFVDDYEAGVGGSIPVRIAALGLGGIAEVAGGLKGRTGQAHEFDTWAQAQAFLERHAHQESLWGHIKAKLGRGGPDMPAPDATWWEAGLWGEASADLHVGLPKVAELIDVHPELGGALVGGYHRRGQEETVYMRLDARLAARLGSVLGSLGGELDRDLALELKSERGRLTRLTLRGEAGVRAAGSLGGQTFDLGQLMRKLKSATAGGKLGGRGGFAAHAAVSLDLTDPRSLAAARGVLDALKPGGAPLADIDDRLLALGRRLNAAASVGIELYRTAEREQEHGGEIGFPVTFGGHYVKSSADRELIGAWASRAGGPLRARDDCLAS